MTNEMTKIQPKIPLARKMIEEAINQLDDQGQGTPEARQLLLGAIALMFRAKGTRQPVPENGVTVDKHVAAQIRAYADQFPWKPLRDIAQQFNTNSGRVSEALRGLR